MSQLLRVAERLGTSAGVRGRKKEGQGEVVHSVTLPLASFLLRLQATFVMESQSQLSVTCAHTRFLLELFPIHARICK